jgi:nucleosome binding factor SPN SPT16 subunit
VDVAFSEGPVNLNWSQIMKTVNEDPKAFFAEGGWSFLHPESEESDVEESASEFEHEEESEEESESDFSEEEENSESEDYSEEDEESGEDWDELERKAARADERKRPSSQEGGSIKKMRR